ncbi:unnamed protein product [Onchocerca ochengi]|uniref:Ovule protein n=1 Tax=Onchocerca ochengi TaxID=42157 RepID=A0A182E2D6_ONCOC|nr:unnamed protein product [Onchocerca ochengi]
MGESTGSNSNSFKQELLGQSQPHVVETITSVEVHHTNETENEDICYGIRCSHVMNLNKRDCETDSKIKESNVFGAIQLV